MNTTQIINLSTRIQRRRDFAAHLTGFSVGTALLLVLHGVGLGATAQLAATITVWAAALSFQHFRHVLRGPVTTTDVEHETKRLA